MLFALYTTKTLPFFHVIMYHYLHNNVSSNVQYIQDQHFTHIPTNKVNPKAL